MTLPTLAALSILALPWMWLACRYLADRIADSWEAEYHLASDLRRGRGDGLQRPADVAHHAPAAVRRRR